MSTFIAADGNVYDEKDVHQYNKLLTHAFLIAEAEGLGRFVPGFVANDGMSEDAAHCIKEAMEGYVDLDPDLMMIVLDSHEIQRKRNASRIG